MEEMPCLSHWLCVSQAQCRLSGGATGSCRAVWHLCRRQQRVWEVGMEAAVMEMPVMATAAMGTVVTTEAAVAARAARAARAAWAARHRGRWLHILTLTPV